MGPRHLTGWRPHDVEIRAGPSFAVGRGKSAGGERILTQTRNPQGLIGWLTTELPFSREN